MDDPRAATPDALNDEVAQLRARIAELERELADQAERANRALAEAQRRTYWLDRWRLDLDALMRRRGIGRALDTALRGLGKLGRGVRRIRRRPGP